MKSENKKYGVEEGKKQIVKEATADGWTELIHTFEWKGLFIVITKDWGYSVSRTKFTWGATSDPTNPDRFGDRHEGEIERGVKKETLEKRVKAAIDDYALDGANPDADYV